MITLEEKFQGNDLSSNLTITKTKKQTKKKQNQENTKNISPEQVEGKK